VGIEVEIATNICSPLGLSATADGISEIVLGSGIVTPFAKVALVLFAAGFCLKLSLRVH
jgi:hypothetical protein